MTNIKIKNVTKNDNLTLNQKMIKIRYWFVANNNFPHNQSYKYQNKVLAIAFSPLHYFVVKVYLKFYTCWF